MPIFTLIMMFVTVIVSYVLLLSHFMVNKKLEGRWTVFFLGGLFYLLLNTFLALFAGSFIDQFVNQDTDPSLYLLIYNFIFVGIEVGLVVVFRRYAMKNRQDGRYMLSAALGFSSAGILFSVLIQAMQDIWVSFKVNAGTFIEWYQTAFTAELAAAQTAQTNFVNTSPLIYIFYCVYIVSLCATSIFLFLYIQKHLGSKKMLPAKEFLIAAALVYLSTLVDQISFFGDNQSVLVLLILARIAVLGLFVYLDRRLLNELGKDRPVIDVLITEEKEVTK